MEDCVGVAEPCRETDHEDFIQIDGVPGDGCQEPDASSMIPIYYVFKKLNCEELPGGNASETVAVQQIITVSQIMLLE